MRQGEQSLRPFDETNVLRDYYIRNVKKTSLVAVYFYASLLLQKTYSRQRKTNDRSLARSKRGRSNGKINQINDLYQ